MIEVGGQKVERSEAGREAGVFGALISVESESQLLDPPQSLKLGRIDQADHQASFDAVVAQRNDVVNRIPIDSWGQVFILLLPESSTVEAHNIRASPVPLYALVGALEECHTSLG